MRAFLILCVAMVVLGYCSQAMATEERVWVLVVCDPKGQNCLPYNRGMVSYRYVTRTACEVDAVMLPMSSRQTVKCDKEKR